MRGSDSRIGGDAGAYAMKRPLLLPLTPLYRVVLAARELRLRSGLEGVRRLQFPVVSVGSLSAGGSGKTPMAIALARALTARGIRVDVLSRGYGRRSSAAAQVNMDGSADQFGDEPLLIARESEVPVYVAAQRYEAGLLAEASIGDAQERVVHLLDDGFQHRQLYRDVDVLLMDDGDVRDHLLPAGNLREPLGALRRAQIVAIPADRPEIEAELKKRNWQGTIWRVRRRMDVPRVDGPVVAFCGIARSDQFFAGLEAGGLHVASRIAFPDHHRYVEHDLDCIRDAARSTRAVAFVTTEKDRVRMGMMGHSIPIVTALLRVEIEGEEVAVREIARGVGF
jgi:tetraacyldisaccharide 4'-kinase